MLWKLHRLQNIPKTQEQIREVKAGVMLKEIDKKFIGNWEVWLLQGGRCQNTVNHYLKTYKPYPDRMRRKNNY